MGSDFSDRRDVFPSEPRVGTLSSVPETHSICWGDRLPTLSTGVAAGKDLLQTASHHPQDQIACLIAEGRAFVSREAHL